MNCQGLEPVIEFYERMARDYDRQYDTPYWKLYHEITWENIRRFLPKRKGAVILDAGGGTGYWAIRLARHGYRVVLTDISESMLKVASEKIEKEDLQELIETRMVDIRDMSCFPSNHFDMALAEGDPVSYCLDAEKAVRELARVVKPNAYVVVSVDSKHSMIPRLIPGVNPMSSFDKLSEFLRTGFFEGKFKLQAFTPEELKSLLETCGLKVIRIIGKPILTQLIPREKADETIKRNFGKILNLELQFCDAPSLVGIGGHLEIVGVKQGDRQWRQEDE